MERRVVVTGVGIVSGLGLSGDDHFEALLRGESAIAPTSLYDVGDFPARFTCQLKGFKANRFVRNRKSIKIMARDIRLAVAAAHLAAADAGLPDGVDEPVRLGVSMGAGLIPSELEDLGYAIAFSLDDDGELDLKKYGKQGLANLSPLWLLKYLPNMLNSHIAIELDAQGPNNCITSGNASGLLAIGEAARVIERGQADWMLAGAAESKIQPLSLARLFTNSKLSTANDLDSRGPRPFCEDRSGLVVGEAGAVVLLEEAEHAVARGARIYAHAAGFGASCGSNRASELEASGRAAGRAMAAAVSDARIEPGEVSAVFANASGLPEDAVEAQALAALLGEGVPVTTTRSACGHTMAAAGALDFATACMAVERAVLPGVFGVDADVSAPVDIRSDAREMELRAVLVNAFSFGGQTAGAVITRNGPHTHHPTPQRV